MKSLDKANAVPRKKPGNYWESEYSIIFHNMPKLENWIYSKKPHDV